MRHHSTSGPSTCLDRSSCGRANIDSTIIKVHASNLQIPTSACFLMQCAFTSCTGMLQDKAIAASYSKIEFYTPLVVQDLGDYLFSLLLASFNLPCPCRRTKNTYRLDEVHRSLLLANCGMKIQTDFAAQLGTRRITRFNLRDPVAGTNPDLVASRLTMSRARH